MKTKHFYYVLFALLLSSFASKAQDGIYLSYPGVTDDLGTGVHEDEVPILDLSFGFTSNATPSTPGTTSFQDLSFTKVNDASSSGFMTALTTGTATNDVEIRLYRTISGTLTLVQTQQFKGVKITAYSTAGSADELSSAGTCGTCTGLIENISFTYAGIKIGAFSSNF